MKQLSSAAVFGATGFIGRALVKRLSELGVRCHCAVRPGSSGLAQLEQLDGIDLYPMHTMTLDQLQKKMGSLQPQVVFNLAASGVAPHSASTQEMVDGNLSLAIAVVSLAAHWRSTRLLHIGSCAEYAAKATSICEHDPVLPETEYGAAKAAASLYTLALGKGLDVAVNVLRLFGVYGPGEAPHRLLPSLVGALQRQRPVDLSPGRQQRDLTFVDDIAEAIASAATADMAPGEVYNVCSGTEFSVLHIAQKTAQVMQCDADLLRFGALPYRQGEAMYLVGDNSKFTQASGWAPKITLEQGIKKVITWHQAKRDPEV